MLVFNVLQDFGDTLQVGEMLEVKLFFSFRDLRDGHLNALLTTEEFDNLTNRKPAQFVEAVFSERASPFAEGLLPRDVVQRHRVGDCAVAVEKVGIENSGRYGKLERQLSVYFGIARCCAAELCERFPPACVTVLDCPT